jgi:hypothetical protein
VATFSTFPSPRAALSGALLLLQAAAGGAVTLAHASEPLTAASHIEAQHEPGCPVLHDALRCALCHYAGAQVVVQQALIAPRSHPAPVRVPSTHRVVVVASAVHRTRPARAPPAFLS